MLRLPVFVLVRSWPCCVFCLYGLQTKMWSQRALKLTSEHDLRGQSTVQQFMTSSQMVESIYQGEGVTFPSHTADNNRKLQKNTESSKVLDIVWVLPTVICRLCSDSISNGQSLRTESLRPGYRCLLLRHLLHREAWFILSFFFFPRCTVSLHHHVLFSSWSF